MHIDYNFSKDDFIQATQKIPSNRFWESALNSLGVQKTTPTKGEASTSIKPKSSPQMLSKKKGPKVKGPDLPIKELCEGGVSAQDPALPSGRLLSSDLFLANALLSPPPSFPPLRLEN